MIGMEWKLYRKSDLLLTLICLFLCPPDSTTRRNCQIKVNQTCILLLGVIPTFERLLLPLLLFGLDEVEDGGSDEKIGESSDDQAESPDVLLLHSTTRTTRTPPMITTSSGPMLRLARISGLKIAGRLEGPAIVTLN